MRCLTKRAVRIIFISLAFITFSLQAQVSYAGPPPPDRDFSESGRRIQFAGMMWGVRGGWGSPGPNQFSDASDSVWVDEDGRLHLKIRKWQGQWYAAEIFSTLKTGYGLHSFSVLKENPTLDAIDPNLVLGLFLYKAGCGLDCHSELDIEFSRWRQAGVYRNAQYVAQPAEAFRNKYPFHLSEMDPLSTHLIDWQADQVVFSSYQGQITGNPEGILNQWTYTGEDIPSISENMLVIIDYWMDRGVPPRYGNEDEIIITDLQIPNICIPVKTISCGETVIGQTGGPGGRDQVDRYTGWPWLETGPEVAYRFTAPASTSVSANLVSGSSSQHVFIVKESESTCSSRNSIADGNPTVSFNTTAGQNYYILVDSADQSGGDFTLLMDCSATDRFQSR